MSDNFFTNDKFLYHEKKIQNREAFMKVNPNKIYYIERYIYQYDLENSFLSKVIENRHDIDKIKGVVCNFLIKRKLFLDTLVEKINDNLDKNM